MDAVAVVRCYWKGMPVDEGGRGKVMVEPEGVRRRDGGSGGEDDFGER